MDSFNAVVEGGASGEVVFDDGDFEASRLWQLMNHDDTPVMPPNQDKIPAEQLELVRKWIEGGLLENSGSKAKAPKKNSLAFVAASSGRPEGGGAMPQSLPQSVPVVTERASAISAIAASPWAPLVAVAGQKQIVMYHSDTGELLGVLPFEEGIAQSLRFSRNGAYLIAGGGEHSLVGVVAIYDVATGKRITTVGDELDTVFDGDANDSMNRIALGGPKKMLRIYDATDGSKLFDLKKHTDWIYCVAYSPDGILIASGDRSGGLCVWEADTGRLYLDLTDHKGAIHSVAWRDDSNVLASASADGTVKVWDMVQGKSIKTISVKGGAVYDVGFDHSGRLVTASADNKTKLWDAKGNHVRDFPRMEEDVLEVEITHDGSRVVYGDWTGNVVGALTGDGKAAGTYAANPPPVAERLKAIDQTLVATRSTLKPITVQLEQANSKFAAASLPLTELLKVRQQLSDRVKAAESKIGTGAARLKTVSSSIPALTASSRDLQDQMVALRVGLKTKSDAASVTKLADAEDAYAKQLSDLARMRRERISITAQNASLKSEVDKLKASLAENASREPELKKVIAAAKAALDLIQSKHDAVANEVNVIQGKRDLLAAEIN